MKPPLHGGGQVKTVWTMGIDQYGQTYHSLGAFPRKALLERLGRKRAQKMFVDTKDGPRHVGYVIAGLWIDLYSVRPWKDKA